MVRDERDPPDDEPENDDDDGGGQELEPTSPSEPQPIPPAPEPDRSALPDIWLTQGGVATASTTVITQRFAPETATFIQSPEAAFVVRMSGDELQGRQVNPVVFADLLVRVTRAARWITNSISTPGATDPGMTAAFAGQSVVVHFTPGRGEERVRLAEGEREFPTVQGGRYAAGLLGLSTHEAELLEAIQPLQKRAVQRWAGTLEQLAKQGVAIDWLTKDRRFTSAEPSQIRRAVEILDQTPEVVTRIDTFSGYLFAADSMKRQFGLELAEGETIRGTYVPEAEETLDRAWDHQVKAEIRVEEARHPKLPRAPRTRYTLLRVVHISPRRRSHDRQPGAR